MVQEMMIRETSVGYLGVSSDEADSGISAGGLEVGEQGCQLV